MAYPPQHQPNPHFPVFPYNPEMAYGPAMMMGHDGANAMVPPPMPSMPPQMGHGGSMGYPLVPPPGAYPSPPQGPYKLPPPPGFHSPLLPPPGFQSLPHASAHSHMFGGPLPAPVQLSVVPVPHNVSSIQLNVGPIKMNDENQRPREPAYRDEARRLSITNLVLEPVENCDNTVKIDVISGGKYQAFIVHRDLLCYFSTYFRGIFQPKKDVVTKVAEVADQEGKTDAISAHENGKVEVEVNIRLPNAVRHIQIDTQKFGPVTRQVFAAFLDWLYNGFEGFGLGDDKPLGTRTVDCQTLVELWVFAGRAGVPQCQNACIEGIEMWRQKTGIIQTLNLAWIYDNTKEYEYEKCGLKKLLVDQCTWSLDVTSITNETTNDEFPRIALVDMLTRIRKLMNDGVSIMGKPFESLEIRKMLYWSEVEDKRVSEVLNNWQ